MVSKLAPLYGDLPVRQLTLWQMASPRVRNLSNQDRSLYTFNELALKDTNVCSILVAIQTNPDWCDRGLPRPWVPGAQSHWEPSWKLATAPSWSLGTMISSDLFASSTAVCWREHFCTSPGQVLLTLLVSPMDKSINDAMQCITGSMWTLALTLGIHLLTTLPHLFGSWSVEKSSQGRLCVQIRDHVPQTQEYISGSPDLKNSVSPSLKWEQHPSKPFLQDKGTSKCKI